MNYVWYMLIVVWLGGPGNGGMVTSAKPYINEEACRTDLMYQIEGTGKIYPDTPFIAFCDSVAFPKILDLQPMRREDFRPV